ncbi:MAG: efflux RND transporter periplasmic adaptor subunit [Rhodospirillales bacterium]|nr:efflux RND transporter periplasmic adaptor subunit [Rhodospirillales bacterium]
MISFLKKGLLPLLVLAVGLGIGAWFFSHPEEAKKRPPQPAQALLVETGQPEGGQFNALIEAMGQVIPAVDAELKAQVSGEIINTAAEFVPGGTFLKGEPVLMIDPEDYELAVRKQEAILKQAQADFQLEQGRQDIAKDELALLAKTTGKKLDNPKLALRAPQLAQAQAEIDKAQADLDTAKLALRRTTITAPFDALAIARHATLGDKVSTGESLATLVSTDTYWVELSVPVNVLPWLSYSPTPLRNGIGSPAVIKTSNGSRKGHLLKWTGALDPDTRLATVLVSVVDPLMLDKAIPGAPQLTLYDYVSVTLEGRRFASDTLRIPLQWLRDGGKIWLIEDGKLVSRSVKIIYEDRTHAYVTEGLDKDDRIVTSGIAVPVEGMALRTAESQP